MHTFLSSNTRSNPGCFSFISNLSQKGGWTVWDEDGSCGLEVDYSVGSGVVSTLGISRVSSSTISSILLG